MEKTKVLIVDDSEVVRNVLNELLLTDPSIEVVATAVDPFDAREKIKQHRPDVITLDIEMPRMDGITFLKNLMKLNPIPVVMLSSLTHKGADETLQALELGAVDYMPKPTLQQTDHELKYFKQELLLKVKAAASSGDKIKFNRRSKSITSGFKRPLELQETKVQLIAIGASAGGTEALKEILEVLPANMPPIVVTQHIPESFSNRFAKRLDDYCDLRVVEAQGGEVLKQGHVYIAPGSRHMSVIRLGSECLIELDDSEPIKKHKPSVERLFDSLIPLGPENTVAILLTGMGDDGSTAMKRLYDAGAHTIAQDEPTSLVWGMPGVAVKLGGVREVVALDNISQRLIEHLCEH